MKRIVLVALMVTGAAGAMAQVYTDGKSLIVPSKPGESGYEKKYVPKNEGSKLLFDTYYRGNIYVAGKGQQNELNIDLEEKAVLFKFNDEIRQLNFNGIDSVVFEQFKIVFSLGDLRGCMLVYDLGNYSIIDHKIATLTESDYNRSLDVGSRDNKWVVNDEFYLIRMVDDYYDKDHGILELPGSRKKIAQLFKNGDEVLAYIKKHGLRFKEVEDYVTLFSAFQNDLK